MPVLKDIKGITFGRLHVIRRCSNINGRTAWLCVCDCGKEVTVMGNSLLSGKTNSCGCIRKENAAAQAQKAGLARGMQLITHGKSNTRLYSIWKSMRQRCNNPNNKYYSDYGGRGIKVCDEWNLYSNFEKWAMENGYQEKAEFGECTIDRIDNERGYEADNCRFVNLKVQANNRRKRRI